ncbi:adenylate kinase [Leadbettera azotonutricia ZAS-9]|uniref:Adenylate kinase n=1 Tax=Leadbettera azotonutricia (strain ATCC BAA-888 / DSM 13862 / ZAS-9) TaxID=545695 RepID=F5YA54_LEAAZ|nr:adenylate kinase [Leadbettera azotonutricia ZAS-9]
MRIHICGPAGCGATTLGRHLAESLMLPYFDSDDFSWEKTDPPFTKAIEMPERSRLLLKALDGNSSFVLSDSVLGWDKAFLEPKRFDLVIYKYVPPDIRLARLQKRAEALYGSRIKEGGDMFEIHRRLLAWAESYESGGMDDRSITSEEHFLAQLSCPVMRIGSEENPEKEAADVLTLLPLYHYEGKNTHIPQKHFPSFRKFIPAFFQRLYRRSHAADIDLWNMDVHLARIILPKLNSFREQEFDGYPGELGSLEAWLAALDEMIYAMEWKIRDYQGNTTPFKLSFAPDTTEEEARAQRGFELFGRYFNWLWN